MKINLQNIFFYKKIINVKILLFTCLVISSVFILSSCPAPLKSVTIVSLMPPKDFNTVLIINDKVEIKGEKSRAAWEVYYRFEFDWSYMDIEADIKIATLRVTANGETFEINIDTEVFDDFHSVVALNIINRSITKGTTQSRSIFLVFLRVSSLFIVTVATFYCFGYRKKRSWIVFAIISLPGEIFINILINGLSIYPMGQLLVLMYGLFFGTIIFILKLIVMCTITNEHRKRRTILCIITTGFTNFFMYFLLIRFLPF